MATKKVQLNPRAAMESHLASSNASAEDRFAKASQITERQPTGLSPVVVADTGAAALEFASKPVPSRPVVTTVTSFDIAECVPGVTVRVPIALIDLNPVGPRQIYLDSEVDKIAATISEGQDDAAHGYAENGRIKLIDGGSRYRAARITDCGFLDVKIEEKPANDLELFRRARALNERRSATTPLDFAMSLKCLFDRGVVKTHREIVEQVEAPDGGKLSEERVSMYMRIGRMPDRIKKDMARHPEANTLTALYAVSGLFEESQTEEALDAAMAQAKDIIDTIVLRKLTSKQISALVASVKSGRKTRQRAVVTPLEFGSQSPWTGQIKTFGQKGQLDLSLKGVTEDDVPRLKALLAKTLDEFLRVDKP